MQGTNEKIEQLNIYIERRNDLLASLRKKEDISNLSHNTDKNLVKDFSEVLKECKVCNKKIKLLKKELDPKDYLKIEEESETEQKAVVLKESNKILGWIKNKIEQIKYNYNVERALKRDMFLEANIDEQIDTFNAYLNVIKIRGNKATFTKNMKKVVQLNTTEKKIEEKQK